MSNPVRIVTHYALARGLRRWRTRNSLNVGRNAGSFGMWNGFGRSLHFIKSGGSPEIIRVETVPADR